MFCRCRICSGDFRAYFFRAVWCAMLFVVTKMASEGVERVIFKCFESVECVLKV